MRDSKKARSDGLEKRTKKKTEKKKMMMMNE